MLDVLCLIFNLGGLFSVRKLETKNAAPTESHQNSFRRDGMKSPQEALQTSMFVRLHDLGEITVFHPLQSFMNKHVAQSWVLLVRNKTAKFVFCIGKLQAETSR